MTRLFLRLSGIPVARARAGEPAAAARWCWRPTTPATSTRWCWSRCSGRAASPSSPSASSSATPLMRLLLDGLRLRVRRALRRAEERRARRRARRGGEARRLARRSSPRARCCAAPGLLPFRTGAFQVAAQAGIPVVPVALRGAALGAARRHLVPAPLPDRGDHSARRSRPRAATGTPRSSCATACAPKCSSTAASRTSLTSNLIRGQGHNSFSRTQKRVVALTPN